MVDTVLHPGDHVYVYCPPEHARAVNELFGYAVGA
jgi:Trk K+ transport system NAD-binding subunit